MTRERLADGLEILCLPKDDDDRQARLRWDVVRLHDRIHANLATGCA